MDEKSKNDIHKEHEVKVVNAHPKSRLSSFRDRLPGDKKRLFLLLLIILAIPLTVVLALYQQEIRSRASGPANSVASASIVYGSEDPQTHELYDIQITSEVEGVKNPNTGYFSTLTTLSVLGPRVNNLTSLYGFKEKKDGTSDPIKFNFNPNSPTRFVSDPVDIGYDNCMDLNSNSINNKETYVATFCYKDNGVDPNSDGVAYSVNATPFFNYTYTGSQPTVIQTLSTAHDRYKYPNPNGGWTLGRFHRVNYFTIDITRSSLTSFKNLEYYFSAETDGLSNLDYSRVCDFPTPAKYLKQTWNVKPEGGSNYPITSGGHCSFIFNSSYFRPAFLSLDMEGGLPMPSSLVSPTPYNNYTPTPGTVELHPVGIGSSDVDLNAGDFYIALLNGAFYGAKPMTIKSNVESPYPSTTTLEVTWNENGKEMRLFMNFKADAQNGYWHLSDLKTYDSETPGNWLYYETVDDLYGIPLGGELGKSTVKKNIAFKAKVRPNESRSMGSIHFANLNIMPFKNYSVAPSPTTAPTPTASNNKLQTSLKCDTSLSFTDIYAKELTASLVDQNGRPVASRNITWNVLYPNSSIMPLISPSTALTVTAGTAYAKVSLPVGITGSGGNTIQADFSGDTNYYPASCQTKVSYKIASSPTSQPMVNKVTLSPNADAYVGSTAPNKNYGTSANLENDLSPDEISYLRFNLATLAGKNIKSAKLVLWTSDPTNSAMNLRNADDSDWSETGITYNKKPAFVNTVTSFTAKIKDAKVTLDVTSRVNSKKGTRVTFGIKSIADDSGAFYSRNAVDASKRPQLVVEYQ